MFNKLKTGAPRSPGARVFRLTQRLRQFSRLRRPRHHRQIRFGRRIEVLAVCPNLLEFAFSPSWPRKGEIWLLSTIAGAEAVHRGLGRPQLPRSQQGAIQVTLSRKGAKSRTTV